MTQFVVSVSVTLDAKSDSEVYDTVNEILRPLLQQGDITDYTVGNATVAATEAD